jgi:hypothetical protein
MPTGISELSHPSRMESNVESELYRYFQALKRIAEMDAHDSPDGYNEWGEASCFQECQKIACEALGRPVPE